MAHTFQSPWQRGLAGTLSLSPLHITPELARDSPDIVVCRVCHSPITPSLKLCQFLLAPEQRLSSPAGKGDSHLMPACLVLCRPFHCQKPQNIDQPWNYLLIDSAHLFLPMFLPSTGSLEENITCAPDFLTECPKALKSCFDGTWTVCCHISPCVGDQYWGTLRAAPG